MISANPVLHSQVLPKYSDKKQSGLSLIMYVLELRTVSALTRGLFWCLNKHQNNTRVSAETVRHESTYIISFLTRHNESINDD